MIGRRKPSDDFVPYRGITRRRRLLIVGLAVATAVTIVLMLLDPPGGVQRKRAVPADTAPCAPGQTAGCVGSKTDVLVAPVTPASAASTSR